MSRQTRARGRSPANGRGLHAPDRPPHTTRVCVYPAGLSPGGALRGPSGALRRTLSACAGVPNGLAYPYDTKAYRPTPTDPTTFYRS